MYKYYAMNQQPSLSGAPAPRIGLAELLAVGAIGGGAFVGYRKASAGGAVAGGLIGGVAFLALYMGSGAALG